MRLETIRTTHIIIVISQIIKIRQSLLYAIRCYICKSKCNTESHRVYYDISYPFAYSVCLYLIVSIEQLSFLRK